MATTKITSPDLFNLESLNSALKLPSGTTAERPTSPSTGEWRYNTTTNLVEFYDGGEWRDLQSEDIPPIPSEHFNTVLYSGDDTTGRAITGVGFKPDFIWIKPRNQTENHNIYDSSRGPQQQLIPNNSTASSNQPQTVQSFDADGFTLNADNNVNKSGINYVAWCWKSGGGTTSSNTDGTQTSTVQVNTKAGFSIVQYTASAAGASETVGHGLGTTPAVIILKRTDGSEDWYVWQKDLGGGGSSALNEFLKLNDTSTESTATSLFNTVNSTVFNPSYTSGVPNTNIAYCFAEKSGYSSFGSYTGNASDSGPIINTGFEPAWLMIKGRTSAVDGWFIVDNKRDTSNPRGIRLFSNSTVPEASESGAQVDFFSNGFQIRGSGAGQGQVNSSGANYVYFAFAATASTAPALADSFANKLYTGTGSPQSITGLGFSPNYVWMKQTTFVDNNYNMDSVRGAAFRIHSNLTAAQNGPDTNRFTSFDTDGFTIGSDPSVNQSGSGFVTWNWKASPLPTINTDGGIQSIVSANQAAGFSIVKWNGTGSAATVGHGLSAAPEIILTKRLNGSGDWYSFSTALNSGTNPAYNFIKLNSSDGEIVNGSSGGSIWNSTSPTATVINVGTTLSGSTSDSYIAYCFHSVSGYSKFGSYTGNGSTQSITGLGFQPNWLMIKQTNGSNSWRIFDSARGLSAPQTLFANLDSQEDSESNTVSSFDSDGWTMGSQQGVNDNGDTYLYMAFKANPGTPAAIPTGEVAYLVIAAGGGAGGVGGGGGAGGLRTSYGNYTGGGQSAESNITLSAQTYTITIGAGGTASATGGAFNNDGNTGSNGTSSVFGTITSIGGGGGTGGSNTALSGGSGGGCRFGSPGSGTYGQGFDGATGDIGGGGGGAGGAGLSSTAGSCGANGGPGLNVPITGATTFYAGGGAGGVSFASGCSASSGGIGGGGDAGANAGTANTGGGGGGGSWTNNANYTTQGGGNGGSGVVILRMNTSDYSGTTTGSPTVTTDGSETILTYTGSGTYVHS